jgi:hypothetical protein
MSEHITQEQAVALAMKRGDVLADRNGRKDFCFDDYGVHALCNAAIQHYKDSQPRPASVCEIMELVGDYWDAAYKEGTESRIHDTPLGDAQFILTAICQAVIRQAEALAQALAEVKRLKTACDKFSESELLAALQYGGELPEPDGYANPSFGFDNSVIQEIHYARTVPIFSEAKVRQAIANALANNNAIIKEGV